MSQAISTIISKKENDDYVCKILVLTIPEHKDMVFYSPLTNEDIYRPGFSELSRAQIREIDEKYGRYIEGTIPEENYSFLVVMKGESYKKISKLSFKNKNGIKMALKRLGGFVEEYNGIFDSRTLSTKFPYLQDFFTSIDDWKAQTGKLQ